MGSKYNFLKLKLLGMINFLQATATNAKLIDITNGVVQNINQLCRCGFGTEHITECAFQCFENSEQQVTFRARLHGTSQVPSSQIIVHLQTYFTQDTPPTIAVQGLHLNVDNSCPITINTFGDPQCTATTSTPMTSDSTLAIWQDHQITLQPLLVEW